jgi:hypothetical protein
MLKGKKQIICFSSFIFINFQTYKAAPTTKGPVINKDKIVPAIGINDAAIRITVITKKVPIAKRHFPLSAALASDIISELFFIL